MSESNDGRWDAEVKERIKDSFKSPYHVDGEHLDAIITAVAAEMDDFETALSSVDEAKFVDTAPPAALEKLATLFDIERRTDESEDSFRARLKVALRAQFSSGTIPEVIDVASTLLDLDRSEIGIREDDRLPAEIELSGIENRVAELDITDAEFVEIMQNVVAAGIGIGILLEYNFDEPVLMSESQTVDVDMVEVLHADTDDAVQVDVNSVLDPLFGDSVTEIQAFEDESATQTDDVFLLTMNVESPLNIDVYDYDDADAADTSARPIPKVETDDDVMGTFEATADTDVYEVTVAVGNVGLGQIDTTDTPNDTAEWEPEVDVANADTNVQSDTDANRTDDVEPARVHTDGEDNSTLNIDVYDLLESATEEVHIDVTTVGERVTVDTDAVMLSAVGAGVSQIDVNDDGSTPVRGPEPLQGGVETDVQAQSDTDSQQFDTVQPAYHDEGKHQIDVYDLMKPVAEASSTDVLAMFEQVTVDVDEVLSATTSGGVGQIDVSADGTTPARGDDPEDAASVTDVQAQADTESPQFDTVGTAFHDEGAHQIDVYSVLAAIAEAASTDAQIQVDSSVLDIDAVEVATASGGVGQIHVSDDGATAPADHGLVFGGSGSSSFAGSDADFNRTDDALAATFNYGLQSIAVYGVDGVDSYGPLTIPGSVASESQVGVDSAVADPEAVSPAYAQEGRVNIDAADDGS